MEVLPFLSKEQVEGIVKYVEKNKPVESLGELMFVRELGMKEREMLRLFVEVRELRQNRDTQDLTTGICYDMASMRRCGGRMCRFIGRQDMQMCR